MEMQLAVTHILLNCPKIQSYVKCHQAVTVIDIASILELAGLSRLRRRSASTMILIYFFVPFGTADPQQYYPNYRPDCFIYFTAIAFTAYKDLPLQLFVESTTFIGGTPSPSGTSRRLSAMRLGDSSSGGRMLWPCASLTRRFVHRCITLVYST
ncbi:hypothetical protein H5410_055972 [Solanum commersonii]|uniref:Uncharacterized protein n=1 Tax=Solanum commersonii TaxID=4109 RepID=A0A9J5WLT3_SOLCO|nr:hypothetical protein H5410_055972 [Solanum commersonii]